MTSMRDFLRWYNNLDVEPFVKAVEKMLALYFNAQLDVFKCSVSVPGLARISVMRHAQKRGVNFALIDVDNADLHHIFRANTFGGPSIIFNRKHARGETYIRDNPNHPCKSIIGYDANALYLYCIGQPQPAGEFIRRRAREGFRPIRRHQYIKMYKWMNYIADKYGYRVQHKLNSGREVKCGPYSLDGMALTRLDSRSNSSQPLERPLVLEFDGCYHHGHKCHLTEKADLRTWKADKRRQRTEERAEYIRARGFDLLTIKECEYEKLIATDPQLANQPNPLTTPFTTLHPGKVTSDCILKAVRDGTFFGFCLVDIQVPEKWKPGFERSLPPREYFAEMAPIFVTTDVHFEDIGKCA